MLRRQTANNNIIISSSISSLSSSSSSSPVALTRRSNYGSINTNNNARAETVAAVDLIESQNSMGGKLMAPRTPSDRAQGELSWRTMRAQEHYFEVPVRLHHTHDWQRAREDWYKVEAKLIWTAFDCPEKIPIFFRDEVIRGHRAVFEDAKWLERALYWVKEARYWRVIGIAQPFYDRDTLRVYTWDDKGQSFGQPVINSAMRDAIGDLERAKKRKDLGLDPNYIWDRWGPNGFVDGARSDYLPRFTKNPYIDPDGVEVEADELNAITSHEQIRDRYKEFIWLEEGNNAGGSDSSNKLTSGNSNNNSATDAVANTSLPFDESFTTITNAYIELHDFSDEIRNFYFAAHLGPMPEVSEGATMADVEARQKEEDKLVQDTDDIRSLIYLSAQFEELVPKFEEFLAQQKQQQQQNAGDESASKNNWELFKQFIAPLRESCDAKVEACRLLHWSSRDAEQAREFFAEKCGFVDFMMTGDKILTAASMAQLRALQTLSQNQEWGLPLCLALTDREKAEAIGVEAFSVWREFEDICIDRRRRLFTHRHTSPANEEKTLDFLLQQFARRPQREAFKEKSTMGGEFDREVEPIGRSTQRRILSSDIMDKTKVDKDASSRQAGGSGTVAQQQARGSGFITRREKKKVDAFAALRGNQFSGQTRF